MGKKGAEKQIFFHLHLLELKVLPPPGVGIYIQTGPDPGIMAFQDELVKLMGKYRVIRVDAVMVPCDRDETQVIELKVVDSEEGTDKDERKEEEDPDYGSGGPTR